TAATRQVGLQPLAGAREARERTRADRLTDRGHHVADAVVLELLRCRSLLVDVVALALAERLIHLAARHVDGRERRVIHAALMTRVLEHGQRLAAVIHEHAGAAELVPGEGGIGRPPREKEAVLLVDLSEVHRGRYLALFQRTEALRGRRLADMHGAG